MNVASHTLPTHHTPQVDAVVFSAGIGENSPFIRKLIAEPLHVSVQLIRAIVVATQQTLRGCMALLFQTGGAAQRRAREPQHPFAITSLQTPAAPQHSRQSLPQPSSLAATLLLPPCISEARCAP